jgi:ArsR family transcriptional regulator
MPQANTAQLAALESLFLGLADKTRLRLLGLMATEPVPVAHLVAETGESQPKISRHLAYLRNAGLVDTTRDGKWIYYGVKRLADNSSDEILQCVLSELSERTAMPAPEFAMSPRAPETRQVIEADDQYERGSEDMDDTSDSPYRPDEIEIFLL